MLFVAKLAVALGGCLIIQSSSSSTMLIHQYEYKIQEASRGTSHFQAIIDDTTGAFFVPREGDVLSIWLGKQIPKSTQNNVYSKTLSPVEGGGVILNMGEDSFSAMRVVKDNEGVVQIQCSSH